MFIRRGRVVSGLLLLFNPNMLALTERRALSVNNLMRFEQNRETPEEDQLVGASRKDSRDLTAGKSASGVPVPTMSELIGARHERSALGSNRDVGSGVTSCSCPGFCFASVVLFFEFVHHGYCFRAEFVGALVLLHGNDELQELRYSSYHVLDMLTAFELPAQILAADLGHALGSFFGHLVDDPAQSAIADGGDVT